LRWGIDVVTISGAVDIIRDWQKRGCAYFHIEDPSKSLNSILDTHFVLKILIFDPKYPEKQQYLSPWLLPSTH
jgi:hypothetical protein